MEAKLKHLLHYMPIGVFTRPQLKRELKRCAELGKPWPFVLAIVPSPGHRSRLAASVTISVRPAPAAEWEMLRWARQTARPVL
jgi:hypothetical protein